MADEGSREPRVVGDRGPLHWAPLVEMTRDPAEPGRTTRRNTKRPGFRAACSDETKLAGLLEVYGNLFPQVDAMHDRLTALPGGKTTLAVAEV